MAGHSHWAGIKHKKALVDAKRGKLWSKLAKAIIVAAKIGGGDPDANLRLRYAIDDAKAVSMPKDNIERAIKKGTGELDGGNLEEIVYEGYGAGGVAVLCEVLTDNRNRTAPEIRKIFEMCRRQARQHRLRRLDVRAARACSSSPPTSLDEDTLMELALEAGADDVARRGDKFEITCDPAVYRATSPRPWPTAGIEPEVSEIARIPQNTVDLDAGDRPQGAQADGAARRPRRRAERLGQLQHPRRGDGGAW